MVHEIRNSYDWGDSMAHYEVIPWREFFKVEQNKMIVYRITPHRSVTNNTNRKMWRLLHKMYEIYDSVSSRLKREGYKFTLREKDNIWFDIVFKNKKNRVLCLYLRIIR